MATNARKWLRIVRYSGIALIAIGVIGIIVEYHDISRCSTAQAGSGCGLALNIEGVGFAFIFAGAVMIVASLALGANVKRDEK